MARIVKTDNSDDNNNSGYSVKQTKKRLTTATVGGREVRTNIPSVEQQRRDLGTFAKGVVDSATGGIGSAIRDRIASQRTPNTTSGMSVKQISRPYEYERMYGRSKPKKVMPDAETRDEITDSVPTPTIQRRRWSMLPSRQQIKTQGIGKMSDEQKEINSKQWVKAYKKEMNKKPK